eukprot:COSAG02_NODE_3757_length_6277_cov_1.750405_4_plen_106_part_00
MLLPALHAGSLRAPFWGCMARRMAHPVGSRAAGTNSSRGGGSTKAQRATEKAPSADQLKRAQSLRLMTAGLVSLAGAFIIMRAQAVGKSKRNLEQQRPRPTEQQN